MTIPFTKMEGIGNDYIYLNLFELTNLNELLIKEDLLRSSRSTTDAGAANAPTGFFSALSQRISDRHFGVGSDGLVLIAPSRTGDVRMVMYNADGSRGDMCGNASRCVGKFVYERGICTKDVILLETDSGIRTLYIASDLGTVSQVRVNMGSPITECSQVPCTLGSGQGPFPITLDDRDFLVTPVNTGNPHAVVFLGESLADFDLPHYGPLLETHTAFPRKANAEFINVLSQQMLRMRVWERGSGITMACGTGACAAAVAAIINGLCNRSVDVVLDGGTLHIEYSEDGNVYMTGPANFVCDGTFLHAPNLE